MTLTAAIPDAPPDPVVFDDWHPVADASQLVRSHLLAAPLLGRELLLWRDQAGTVRAWEDRCPHRGTRLSIGCIESHGGADQVVCRYHGWRFGADARCSHVPAQPDQPMPASAQVQRYHAAERYGLVWVCLGQPAGEVLPFPEYADPALRKVLCGPYDVDASGPRIVENFLDMAHFGFVHAGILGHAAHTAVHDYQVADWDDGAGGRGLLASGCFAWQPQTNSLAHGGSEVEYTYRVVRPLSAILTKLPQAQSDFREAISLHVQPLGQERSRVWIVLALTNFQQTEDELRAFQDRIFLQDLPILENQVPKKLPIRPGMELPVRCDRMSTAYRAWLRERGMRWGVVA